MRDMTHSFEGMTHSSVCAGRLVLLSFSPPRFLSPPLFSFSLFSHARNKAYVSTMNDKQTTHAKFNGHGALPTHTRTHTRTRTHTHTHACTYIVQTAALGANEGIILQHTATHCNTLQHTATHCNTLQHTATHCNTHHVTYG